MKNEARICFILFQLKTSRREEYQQTKKPQILLNLLILTASSTNLYFKMADNETNEEPQQIQEVLAGEREEEEVVESPRKRFKITSEEEENAWTLPEEMLEYVNEQFENYINEKDLKESILSLHPIPSNMRKVKKLDIFLQEL